jgi:hypothetical protein
MIKKTLKTILVLSFVVLAVAYLKKDNLPDNTEILPEIYQNPIQTKTDHSPFNIEAENMVYSIKPLYNYELYGMVVSYHYCGVWWDIYHHDLWKDYINIKDLCVVWGENIETEVYKDMEFSSNSWTCNYRWPDSQVKKRFCKTCLSNNHLLSEYQGIKRKLMNTEIGDQIYIKGYLAEYSQEASSFKRGTSITRTDTGNGACETIYIEDYQILKKANAVWHHLFGFSKYAVLCCILLLFIMFFTSKHNPD